MEYEACWEWPRQKSKSSNKWHFLTFPLVNIEALAQKDHFQNKSPASNPAYIHLQGRIACPKHDFLDFVDLFLFGYPLKCFPRHFHDFFFLLIWFYLRGFEAGSETWDICSLKVLFLMKLINNWLCWLWMSCYSRLNDPFVVFHAIDLAAR